MGVDFITTENKKKEDRSIGEIEPVLLVSPQGYYLGANRNTERKIIEKLQRTHQKIQSSDLVEKTIQRYFQ